MAMWHTKYNVIQQQVMGSLPAAAGECIFGWLVELTLSRALHSVDEQAPRPPVRPAWVMLV